MAKTDPIATEKYSPYKGTLASEQAAADSRELANKAVQDAFVAQWLAAEEQAATRNRDQINAQIATNLQAANLDASSAYSNQIAQFGPMTGTADAILNAAGQNAQGVNMQNANNAIGAAQQQYLMNQNALQGVAGQQNYQNVALAQQRANDNANQQWQAALQRDQDMWGRMNTTKQQGRAQKNTNREADFAKQQADAQLAIDRQNIEIDRQNVQAQINAIAQAQAAAAQVAAGGGGGGYSSSGSGQAGGSGEYDLYVQNRDGQVAYSTTKKLTDAEAQDLVSKGWAAIVPKGTDPKSVASNLGGNYKGSLEDKNVRRAYYGRT